MGKKLRKGVPFKMLRLAGMAALLSFPLGSAFAVTTVESLDPAWRFFGPGGWALTETPEGTSEPVGDFVLNEEIIPGPTFFGANYYEILDQNLGISDIITVGPGPRPDPVTDRPVGEIKFYSDLNDLAAIKSALDKAGYKFSGVVCTEGNTGCSAPVDEFSTRTTAFIMLAGSDGEGPSFDPFGAGFNSSDQIFFNSGVTPVTPVVPLPAALPLFASGLAGLGWVSRRRRKGCS